jgi:hypothetical protein
LSLTDTPCVDVPVLAPTGRLVDLPPLDLRDARTGEPPRLKTHVRIGWRRGALLVRFDGRDDQIVATLTKRNDPIWTEDVFEVFLSPHDPPTPYYEFEVNPLGTTFQARVDSPALERKTMRVNTTWGCHGLSARISRGEGRWSANLSIPLAPLAQGAGVQTWRANFFRIDRGAIDEYSAWSPTYRDPSDFHVPARFGSLRFPPA